MNIIAWLVLGLVAGTFASRIVGHHGQGVMLDIVLGIAGAFVGGALFELFVGWGVTGFDGWSLLVATAGAIVVLLLWNSVAGSRRRPMLPAR